MMTAKKQQAPAKNLKQNIELLTPREQEVLAHLAYGASNKEIAAFLDIKLVTVKLHVSAIYRKLGVKNRTQAALIAHENETSLTKTSKQDQIS